MDEEFFTQNRRRLLELAQISGPIVVPANGLLQRNGDSTFPFRQDSNFYYLTGLNEPDLVLVVDENGSYLIVPDRDQARTAFDGPVNLSELSKSGIREILDDKAGWEKLKDSVRNANSLATLEPTSSYNRQHGMFTNPARARLIRKLRRLAPSAEIKFVNKLLAEMRMFKQAPEIEQIQKAISITSNGIKNITGELGSFNYEYEIEAALTANFRSSGTAGHAFQPIIASGKNACTLHNVTNGSKLTRDELVTIDVGAEVNNYAADITRTLAIGRPTSRQMQVFDAVLAAQNYALELLKPGIYLKDYEQKVASFLGGKMMELGLIKTKDGENIRKYYPHATSHFLGLDVHDVGDYSKPLAENMVITCEPGIYIPEEAIGVRIEDDVLITKNGNVILSGGLPREL